MKTLHTFHIPVMGIGFTLDTPIKIAKYGIDSCISLVQDHVIEKARGMYAKQYKLPYVEITEQEEGYRYKRITAYLNLVHEIVQYQFKKLLTDVEETDKYFELLPDSNPLKEEYFLLKNLNVERNYDLEKLLKQIEPGSIDVNIMSKLDRLDEESGISDALAALKGYAESNLNSSIVFSAGINPRLIAYVAEFGDFFPQNGKEPKKKIVLKVSDFRSARIQANMLVKKGLWPHEFRVESGLNCGGHAFATQGYLLGPVLEEFKQQRQSFFEELKNTYLRSIPEGGDQEWLPEKFLLSVQGGVGSADEHSFLQEEYGFEKAGWGSPFLLVPEATSVDEDTIKRLAEATEEDIYLSHASPLGVTYNNLRTSQAEELRRERIAKDKPGSPCFRKHVVLSTEFGKPMCSASREFQKKKITELKALSLPEEEYTAKYEAVVEKECICDGLGVSFLKLNNLSDKYNTTASSICPGPNLAYYDRIFSLKEMIDHIYGRAKVLSDKRPHMFMKELDLYVDYFKQELLKVTPTDNRAVKCLDGFRANLIEGITYYEQLFASKTPQIDAIRSSIIEKLHGYKLAIS